MSWPEKMLRIDGRPRKYPEPLLDRGVRPLFESGRPIAHVAKDLGISSEVLRKRVLQAEAETVRGRICRPLRPSARRAAKLRRANEIPKAASVFSPPGARRTPIEVSAFIDEHRARFGVEPDLQGLGVSASADYQRAKDQRSARAVENERLLARICGASCIHAQGRAAPPSPPAAALTQRRRATRRPWGSARRLTVSETWFS
jgi:transposase